MGTSSADALGVLTRGDVTIRGRMPGSSNAIFFVDVACDGVTVQAVYKPERGERPLWDFPPGLFRREVAAYALSEALQWGLVPLTVERDGPYGEGSFQLFVEADFASTTSRCARTPRMPSVFSAFVSSTWWPTTPIARPATVCSAPTAACMRSTTP